ncbi:MAG: C13 family peptidase [Caulobacteraceae bacterium]
MSPEVPSYASGVGVWTRGFGWVIAALALAGCAPPAAARGSFADWAAVVVAGDDHGAHDARPTETFDNARRDVSAALEARGLPSANLRQFSVRPGRHPDTHPLAADLPTIQTSLRDLAARARGGCLIYFTSHGNPEGVVLGGHLASPASLARLIDAACPGRPVVAVISACFSGVFIPALRGPDRMVLTAARRDRSSFGCSENDKYPYFDDCLLRSLPGAADFIALAPKVQTCVAARERSENVGPPSRPQVSIGPELRKSLPPFALAAPGPK